jgi:hypothetical protein
MHLLSRRNAELLRCVRLSALFAQGDKLLEFPYGSGVKIPVPLRAPVVKN